MTRVEPRSCWADVEGLRLHYLDWPGDGPALLCLHGLTANCRYWDALAERMTPRYRVIAVDLRGRGQSDKPPDGNYGVATHVRDMAALVKATELGPVTVVGHSMGAFVAALLATDYPDLVSRAVLVDGGGMRENQIGESVRAQIQGAIARLSRVFPSLQAYLDFWRQMPYANPWNEHWERYLAADLGQCGEGSLVCRASPAAVEEDLLSSLNMWEYLPRVRVPALVLWAPQGLLAPDQPLMSGDLMEEVARLLPQGRLVTVRGANHYTIALAPECLDQMESALSDLLGTSINPD